MYNLLNGNLTQSFTEYPADLFLYFRSVSAFSCTEPTTCLKSIHLIKDFPMLMSFYCSNQDRSYFPALGAADLTVASNVLNKDSLLLGEARSCLDIYINASEGKHTNIA